MDGPGILVRSLSVPFVVDSQGRRWQYFSRSDRHSKLACWGIVFDLLRESKVLRAQADSGEIAFGINHEMREFSTNRKKKLDLVICTPRESAARRRARTFADLRLPYGVELTPAEVEALNALPPLVEAPVGTVRVAVEAKAAMTAHVKAIPRLFDELNSSHQTIHAVTDVAVATGFVMVNTADEFVSPDRNKAGNQVPDVVSQNDPHGAARIWDKVGEIPRRLRPGTDGYDALGIVLVDMRNDGTPVRHVPGPLNGGSVFNYDQMIRRMAQLYEARFR